MSQEFDVVCLGGGVAGEAIAVSLRDSGLTLAVIERDLVVSDIEAARAELIGRGAEVSEAFHFKGFGGPRVSGPAPNGGSYVTFAAFSDPDGNSWLLQEIKTRLPGRGLSSLDVATLTELLRETETHHGEYEPTAPKHHWSGWYAAYIVARERGRTPDEAAKDAALDMERARDHAPA